MPKHHKKTFENIAEEKRQRILATATSEFAEKGFGSANINVIAEKAGISIGSMYKYFESKDDLFLTVVDQGYKVLQKVFEEVKLSEGTIFDKLESLLRAALIYSRKYPELNIIYLDLTSQGLTHLSRRLSRKMETISASYYRELIRQGKADGLVAKNIDEGFASFCIDNLILMLQYAHSSKYFRERMQIFAGNDALNDEEKLIREMLRFIRNAIGTG
jgi:AcrR family transcriptional regulator